METRGLEKLGNGAFRSLKLDEGVELNPEDLLNKADGLTLAARGCDGAYYPVYSELADIVKKRVKEIKRGQVDGVVKEIFSGESCHGQRFVIFQEQERAFLLGELAAVLRLLGEK